jgi:hypothetical protein
MLQRLLPRHKKPTNTGTKSHQNFRGSWWLFTFATDYLISRPFQDLAYTSLSLFPALAGNGAIREHYLTVPFFSDFTMM